MKKCYTSIASNEPLPFFQPKSCTDKVAGISPSSKLPLKIAMMKKNLLFFFLGTLCFLAAPNVAFSQTPGGVSPNLKLWLKGNAGVTTSGGTVSAWADQSGLGYLATQPTALARPGYTAAAPFFNGNPSVDFDLVDDGMSTNVLMYNRPYSFFVVYNSTSTSAVARRAIQGDNNWLIGPYTNSVSFHANPFVENGQIPSSKIPSISTATSNAGTTNNAFFYYNGQDRTPAGVTAPLTPGRIFLAGAGAYPAQTMGGSIAEIIAYTSLISPAERNKIESYLAVKYGITLDQTVPIDYTRSDGTIIWDHLYNGVYNKNIFGVGKDNTSGLNQTQSQSVNTNTIRIDNPSALANGDFLLLSDNGLSAGPTTQPGLPGGAVAASTLIWTVSKTGTVGTIDITIAAPSANSVLLIDNNNDGIFEMAVSPSSVSGNTNTYTGVSLNQYAKIKIGYLKTCVPGGVAANMKLWLNASGVQTDGAKVTVWPDYSGSGVDFSQTNIAQQPDLVTNAINNNPAVKFTGDLLTNPNGLLGTSTVNDINIYSVVRVNTSTGSPNFFRNPVSGGELAIYLPFSNTLYWRPKTPDVTIPFASIPNNTLPRIYSFHSSTVSGQTYPGTKSALVSNNKVFASGATFNGFTGVNGLTNLGSTATPNSDVAEFIVYPGVINPAQNNKIQTYLAVKYGISLDQTVATNYTSSNGTVVWNAAANSAYTNNIFGIGLDTMGCLDQRTSVSVNTNRISISNPSALVNGGYLIVSDNNLSLTPVAEGGLPGGATLGTPLVWSASKTGGVGTVTLTIASNIQGAILLVDNNNDGVYETAIPATTQTANGTSYTNTFAGVNLNNLAKFKLGYKCLPSQSNTVTIEYISTPTITTCSGKGTFVVRVKNLGLAPITNLIFKDSLPPAINYVPGSVSGTGVTFGSTILANNVVTFNVASIPSSAFVDISFDASVNCAVSTDPLNIKNTYRAYWDCFFSPPSVTPTYPILFPSLSITLTNANATVGCYSPFVRTLTICNGGFGSVDSVTVSDVQGNSSLVIQNFSMGTVTGQGTTSGKTVLHAADFMTVGNGDGKLDQNECITINDTLLVVGGATPIAGTLRADWGCNAMNCMNGTNNNTVLVNTIVTSGGGTMGAVPSLTRTLSIIGDIQTDSAGQIYNRPITYREVVKNNSTATATNVSIHPTVTGLKYIDRDSIWAYRNGDERYHPNYTVTGFYFFANPAGYCPGVQPYPFPGYDQPSHTQIALGDIAPGDSVVVTFVVGTAGPVTKYIPYYQSLCSYPDDRRYCDNTCYARRHGPSIGGAVDAGLYWQGLGCPGDTYSMCNARFPNKVYNGRDAAPIDEYDPKAGFAHWLARYSGFSLIDSTNLDNELCAYGEDTLRLLFKVGVIDIPFFSDRSKFYIKIKTNGGIKWDGNLGATFGRLTSWSNEQWQADHVDDRSAIDSTILVYFKRSNLPPTAMNTFNTIVTNSYTGGTFELAIHLINQCPGPAVRRVYTTRYFEIDSTNNEPGIESGNFDFQAGMDWNSICPGPCTDGVQVLDFSQKRSTFGLPDNNGNGLADASGSLNFNIIKDRRITWGDTLQVKYRMVVKTTKPGGVPYMYMKSTINYVTLQPSIDCNNFLKKDMPIITLTRPSVGVFNGVGSSTPVNTSNTYLANLSLQGAGGITLPGIDAYQDGDTIDYIQNIVYYTPHYGWDLVEFNLLHVPYTALVSNPTIPQQFKCDSVICNIETIDMDRQLTSSVVNGGVACGTTNVIRIGARTQIANSNCGSDYFPGEVRHIVAPTYMKVVIPASSRWVCTQVRAYLNTNIKNCMAPINNVLPPSLYFYSGDTLMLDLKAIHAYYGVNTLISNLYSLSQFDLSMVYTPTASQTTCLKDHADLSTSFAFYTDFTASRPVDTTTLKNVGGGVTAALTWPGGNNNTLTMYAGSNVSVSSPYVVVPVQYNKGTSLVYGNDFIAIPPAYGIEIDSVKDQVTGQIVPTVPGSNIYKVGYIAANSNRRFNIYTHVTICSNNTLKIYADRTPCSGYPTSWDSYACKAYAHSATFTYVTFMGELQMVDSLFHVQKDICTDDTIQFKVVNSQTQNANTVKVSFILPQSMDILPGQTQLRLGNGAFVTVSDPVLTAGTYSWTLSPADTLYKISQFPLNTMYLRVGVTTSCGFISGSQITSSIAGKVGCGDITSLYNTNPPPLTINGAPSLSYFTNPKAEISQVDNCTPGAAFDYKVTLLISGDQTGVADSMRVTLPNTYGYFSYNPSAPGSHNSPPAQPFVVNLPDGKLQLSWVTPAGVQPGDSIKYTFKYRELSPSNKCAADQKSWISTFINSGVYCVKIMAICPVGIQNGADSVTIQSLKPSLSTNATATFTQGCANAGKYSYVSLAGSILNSGSADVNPGTNIIMEVFLDMDGSGTINAGDKAFSSFEYAGGLEIDSSHTYTYLDSMLVSSCLTCPGKNILLRFSNMPDAPMGSSQCLCDTLKVISIIPELLMNEKPDAGLDQIVTCAVLPGGVGTLQAVGTGTWSIQAGNPGTSVIANPGAAQTNVTTFSAIGDYFYIWSDGSCQDTAKITVTAKPNAGTDQVVSCVPTFSGGSATMAGIGSGTWTAQVGNPGTATITTPGSPTTTITNYSVAGVYKFIFTNGTCTDTAQVTVSDKINAGVDKTVDCVILPGGSATAAALGTGTWTAQLGNPGTASITTPSSPTTTFTTFSAVGTYNFIWSQGACSDTMKVVVTAKPNAGTDQMISCVALPGGTVTMAASGTGTWSAMAGNPGAATITTPGSPTTTITTFPYIGTYRFLFTNGSCSDTATVTVTMKPNAGPDKIACVTTLPTSTTTMAGVGLGTWTADPTNPGTATIDFPNSQSTSITGFTAYGTYKFILTYGACSDTAMVEVQDKPSAGPDQTASCIAIFPGGTATMAAVGAGSWVAQAGNPGTSTIVSPNSNTTVINMFSAVGTYKYIWSDGPCTDTAFVVVTGKPNAGIDKTLTCVPAAGSPATMTAVGIGTWAAQTGNPTPAPVITTASSPTTTITGFKTAGTYRYIWTVGLCKDTVAVIVTAQPNAGVDKTVSCVVFPGGSVAMTATAVTGGTWTAQAGNPGTATITNPTLATTTITTYSAAGTYHFIWTNAAMCSDTVAVTVTGKPTAGPDQMFTCLPNFPGGTATMAAVGSGSWSAQTGNPGMATITFNLVPTTTINAFTAPGIYKFIWTAAVTGCTDTMNVNITFVPNAGADQTACGGSTETLTGTISTSGTWTAAAGNPVGATLGSTTVGVATVGFANTASGVFQFIYTADACVDTMKITVTPKPNAGPDQTLSCTPTLPGGSATMAALGTGTWTAQGDNPGTSNITTAGSPTTSITMFSAEGTYHFIWTTNGCTDTVAIVVRRCVLLSGNIFDDANGLSDNTLNGPGTNAGGLFVVLVDNMGNVVGNAAVAADGTYSFPDVAAGTYSLVLSTTAGTIGQPAPSPSLPMGWVNTGEFLGTGMGNDGPPNGSLGTIVIGSADVTNANFGIEQPPTANSAMSSQSNPGGTIQVMVPILTGSDPEQGAFPGTGNQDTIQILTLPTNATLYYNGIPVLVGQVIPNYDPSLLTVDPDDGNITVVFTFAEIDAAGQASPPATVTMDFTVAGLYGNVFDDMNGLPGDNTVNGIGTNAGGLTAVLVDNTNTVVDNSPVAADGTYGFPVVLPGDYSVVLSTVAGTVGMPPPSPSLPSPWVNTGEHLGANMGSDGTIDGILIGITIAAAKGMMVMDVMEANFGINQPPTADDLTVGIQPNPGGLVHVTVPPLTGSDPEQGALPGVGNQNTIQIVTLPAFGILYYNGVPVTAGQIIPNYDPSLLTVDPNDAGDTVVFTFSTIDAAGAVSPPATVTMPFEPFNNCTPPVLTVVNGGVCAGGYTLNLNTLVTGNAPVGALTFHLTPADATAGTNALLNSTVAPAVNTTYYVRSTINSTCFATAMTTVTVVANPNPTMINGTVCSGGSIDLASLVTNADGGTLSFYTTKANAEAGTTQLPSSTVSPASATNYYVRSTVTSSGVTCYGVKEITVTMEDAACGTPVMSGGN
jgi:uncharacterized repeat protein (TIGR01451 family)